MTTKQLFKIRRSEERGGEDHGWLKPKHSFSFANYYDPEHMGFRSLRVINEDIIAGGSGFPTHPHANMEIFSYILSGALAHKDSMGNSATLKPGMIQLMSAGSGVTHSEYNPSPKEPAHLLQIWSQPNEQNLTPSYTEWEPNQQQNDLKKALIISENGREQSATIHQDVSIYKIQLNANETISHTLEPDRGIWIQLIKGSLTIGEHTIHAGDAISTEDPGNIEIAALKSSEAILFDLV